MMFLCNLVVCATSIRFFKMADQSDPDAALMLRVKRGNRAAFAELVDETALEKTVLALNRDKSWDWESAGRIWPYLHMKWMLARLSTTGPCSGER